MAFFELGKMTLGSIFKKPETVLYPVQTKEKPAGLKGEIVIDEANCILCGSCQRVCPTDSIVVDRENRTWQINNFSCIMCSMCVRGCPKKCLEMTVNAPAVSTTIAPHVVNVPEQPKPERKAPEAQAASAAAPASE